MPKSSFAKVLRRHRLRKRISQEKLAFEANLDRTYISMLERALRQPSLEVIIAISRSLDISASQIVADVEQELGRFAARPRRRVRRQRRAQPRRAV